MTARRSASSVRRPLVVSALGFVAAFAVACGAPNDSSGQPSATEANVVPSAASASDARATSTPSEPGLGASYLVRVEPAGDAESVTITLLNELVEPAASATITSGGAMEAAGALGPGTYTVEAAGATCDGELQLTDGVEVDAIVRVDAAATTCAVEAVGSHAPGEGHRFAPR